MRSMSATNIAAWWGAGIATVVLLWDVFKWWRASVGKLRVSANPNLQLVDRQRGEVGEKKYIFVEVTNPGEKRTTITHLVGYNYRSLWQWVRRKHDEAFAVVEPLDGQIPFVLEPGARWSGGIEQSEDIERWSREGRLFVGVNHSLAQKAKLVRVKIPETDDENGD